MKVLLFGHRSFAAKGLPELLRGRGHEVVCFSRGKISSQAGVVTGPLEGFADNPHLAGNYDVLINYILLKDDGIAPNVAFVRALLEFCVERKIPHLIHISSVSSYDGTLSVIRESSPTAAVPESKGAYGSLKVATDLYLQAHAPKEVKVSFVRPGFILGEGLINPVIGNAARLPWNRLLLIGSAASRMPLIRRADVNQAVARLVESPPTVSQETLLLVDSQSPTKRDFFGATCEKLGMGTSLLTLPTFMWYGIAMGAECAARMLGQGKMKPYSKLASRLRDQSFDSGETQKRLGMDFSFDWPAVLQGSLDRQKPSFELPPVPAPLPTIDAKAVTFLGFGRIVKQKHLPALSKLGFMGEIRAYDLRPSTSPEGQEIQAIQGASLAPALFVVASPGPAHVQALGPLARAEGPILVEKPLAVSQAEFERWRIFAAGRKDPVYACHNYRLKQNVLEMGAHLRKSNPGELLHVHVHFQSPPAAYDGAPWLRAERSARTLLMDYGLHFMDLACQFGRGDWQVNALRHTLDSQGHTALIEGNASANYSISFLLRQGLAARRARILFTFQNYCVSLGFFPDTFAVFMSDDNPWHHKAEKRASMRALVQKIRDKLTNKDADLSHARAIAAAAGAAPQYADVLRIEKLDAFYRFIFAIADRTYGFAEAV